MEATAWIYADWDKYNKKFIYRVRNYETDSEILVEKRVLQFASFEEAELRRQMHAILIKKKNEVLADAYVEAGELEAQANELLALEDKSNE